MDELISSLLSRTLVLVSDAMVSTTRSFVWIGICVCSSSICGNAPCDTQHMVPRDAARRDDVVGSCVVVEACVVVELCWWAGGKHDNISNL